MKLIVDRCKEGDQEAWNMLVNSYSKRVYNVALNFTKNSEDAADLTQDIFVKLYTNLEKYTDEYSFNSWFMRLVKNHCIDHWRRDKKNRLKSELEENMKVLGKTPEDTSAENADKERLRTKIKELEPENRMMLTMRDIEGASYKDISSDLEIPVGTVKSRINRARIKLAKLFLEG